MVGCQLMAQGGSKWQFSGIVWGVPGSPEELLKIQAWLPPSGLALSGSRPALVYVALAVSRVGPVLRAPLQELI